MEISAEEDFHRSHYLDLQKGKVKPSNYPLEPIRIENDDELLNMVLFSEKLHLMNFQIY